MKNKPFLLSACVFLGVSASTGWAQPSTPEALGIFPQTPNLDLSPDYQASAGGGTRDVSMDYIGTDPVSGNAEFAYFGSAFNECSTGKRKVFSAAGVQDQGSGFLSDQGNDFIRAWALSLGVSPGAYGDFGSLDGDAATGNYIITSIVEDLTVDGGNGTWQTQMTTQAAGSIAGLAYHTGGQIQTTLFQRFDRDGAVVTPANLGRNVPAGLLFDGINWVVSAGRQRPAGCAILSNGNNVYVIADEGGNSGNRGPQHHFFANNSAGQLSIFSIGNAAGNAFPVSTQPLYSGVAAPNLFAHDGATNTGASPNGWWASGISALSVRRNDGSIIGSFDQPNGAVITLFNGTTDPLLFPNGGGTFLADDDETRIACGPDHIIIPGQYTALSGAKRTALARFLVDPIGGTVTPLSIIDPSEGLPDPVNFASRFHTAVDFNANGDFVVSWRDPDNGAVLARVYNPDHTPRTGIFYVSADGADDNLSELVGQPGVNSILFVGDHGNNDGKAAHLDVGMGDEAFGVMWLTSSGVASASIAALDCFGLAKGLPLSHAGRIFRFAPSSQTSNVENWDLVR